MSDLTLGNKKYEVDEKGFLVDFHDWDENFATILSRDMISNGGLTGDHWKIIKFIRDSFAKSGKCPLVYETCRANGLRVQDLQKLFPSGYLRGACKLAGLTYKDGYGVVGWIRPEERIKPVLVEKVYRLDVRGFLIHPQDWDEDYARYKAHEMKLPQGLTEKHWEVINYLRRSFRETGVVPTVYDACEANRLSLDEMEKLFPDGYHRGAIKISGLRVG